ncbi:MAG: plasmid replication/partition related protein [Pseudomonadota bacterium]
MDLVVNEELKACIDPLTADEEQALERSLLAEGCRDALVLWGDVLVDGHNRYRICRQHGLPFQTVQNPRFQCLADVQLWMIDQHLGRRSLSDFQRGVLALRKRELVAERGARSPWTPATAPTGSAPEPVSAKTIVSSDSASATVPLGDGLTTREALAKAARLSSGQVAQIEKIQKHATPDVVAAVKAGTLSLNAAAAVASLPPEEQTAAAALGHEELKLAARRVREGKRKLAAQAPPPSPAADGSASDETLASLRERVAALTAENTSLRAELAKWRSQPVPPRPDEAPFSASSAAALRSMAEDEASGPPW